MKSFIFIIVAISLATTSTIHADISYVSIPASAFSSSNDSNGYKTNGSGTTRLFRGKLFAPVNLPHKSTITSLLCGAKPSHGFVVDIKLRRNDPPQANVDMAWIGTSRGTTGPQNILQGLAEYQYINTREIWPNQIDNQRYNYYIEASAFNPYPNNFLIKCPNGTLCGSINFCRLEYKY